MKKLYSVATFAAVFAAGTALAADLPSRKGPPAALLLPPPPLWTGFYVGLNAGGAWSATDSATVSTFNAFNNIPALSLLGQTYGPTAAAATSGVIPLNSGGGFIGGGQIGYNWQFNNVFVAGVEADIQGVAASTRTGSQFVVAPRGVVPGANVAAGVSVTSRLDYLGTVRGRLGYLVTPTLLAYATAGLAYGGVQSSTSIFGGEVPNTGSTSFFGAGNFSDTRVGWTVGGGGEWLFMPNWSAKIEYLYYDLGDVSYQSGPLVAFGNGTNSVTFANISQTTTRSDGHVVRAGLNYHFNWAAAPVVARY
jgi:outer membrane immunogenic protein